MKKSFLVILIISVIIIAILQLININNSVTRILGGVQILLILVMGYTLGKKPKKNKS